MDALHGQRSHWTPAHVYGELAQQMADPRPDRLDFATEPVVPRCINLTVDDNHRFAHADLTRFTSQRIVDAERRVGINVALLI
jgi:hypothetical protein